MKDTATMTMDELIASGRTAEQVGNWDEAIRSYEAAAEGLSGPEDASRRADCLRSIGRVYFERGDFERATVAFESALVTAQSHNLRKDIASALNCLAIVAQFRGRLDVAEPLYDQAAALAEEVGNEFMGAMIAQNLGTMATSRGDLQAALLRYRSALQRFKKIGDERSSARVLNNMGMAHVDLAEWGPAQMCFDAAYTIAQRLSDLPTLGKIDVNRADLFLKRQNFERAREACERAFRNFTRLGSDLGLGETYLQYGILYRETGKPQLADIQLQLALKLSQVCEIRLLEAETESERALVFLSQGRYRDALLSLNRGHQLFQDLQARREVADIERRLDRLEDRYLVAIQSWEDDATPSGVPSLFENGNRVSKWVTRLGEAVGCEGSDLTWLRIGSFLYDVGKTTVPVEVLNKPGQLSGEEWSQVKRHVVAGADMVAELGFPADLRPIVRNHHENWDGSGYPDGLRGTEIPLQARILTVVDQFSALTAERPFRPAYSAKEALGVMEKDAGRKLDPELFRVFRTMVLESTGVPVAA